MTTNLLIAEDHSLTLKGLSLLAGVYPEEKEPFFSVGSCRRLMKQLATKAYTHLILDILLSDGSALESIPTIRNLYPDLEIMIFSAQPAALYERALLRYRIFYIVGKDMPEQETLRVMRQFLTNQRPGPLLLKKRTEPFAGMPPREIDVLHYLLKGWKTSQIAETPQSQQQHHLYAQVQDLSADPDQQHQRVDGFGKSAPGELRAMG